MENPAAHLGRDSSNLDFLRATAVLAVFVSHAGFTLGITNIGGLEFFNLGRVGVLIFFVHTSFVLMASMSRSCSSAAHFYVRRCFRIYPLAVFCVLLTVALRVPESPWLMFHPHSLGEIVSNLLLIQNLTDAPSVSSQLWSLPFEVQMYILLPWIFLALKRWPAWMMLALSYGLCALASLLGQHRIVNLIVYGPCFMAGVLAFRMRPLLQLPGALWVVAVPATVVGTALVLAYSEQINLVSWCGCLVLALMIPLFAELTNPAIRKVSALIARYSYGIYMTHFVALWCGFVVLRDQSMVVRVLTALSLAVALPVASYHLIEEPMIRRGKIEADRLLAIAGRTRSALRMNLARQSDAGADE
jgi:peptidoglycan/LPS O-acetylase OafA/YrhL